MIYHENIIVGGGASGLFCAISAKYRGKDVAIIESTGRVGNKILTTGNGRCNISNNNITYPFNNYTSANPGFFIDCLNAFSVEDTKNLLLSIGLPLVELDDGKLFPRSLQASSVLDILRLTIEEMQIPVYTDCKLKSIKKTKGFLLSTSNQDFPEFKCNKLVLSCGGKSAPKTGSDGLGYNFAKKLGHNIIEPIPAIVQLKLDYPYLKAISGIKFNGNASVIVDGSIIRQDSGEILFTDYGLSGPPILQLSQIASRALSRDKKTEIKVDMMPEMSYDDVENFIQGHLSMFPDRSINNALIGIISKKLIPTLLKDSKITDIHVPCSELSWNQKENLITRFKDWTFKCTGTNGFNNAQLTAGGVDTTEVYPDSLGSKLIDNLYFCGEILDVNGDCGGFNLQWAWSSGFVVGSKL